ncbi:MAG: class I SAM-dependent methyltransferase [Phycisphaerales bacterium]|nr:class I SAM-dependent methyltransferase [Phycisphaerales bacterium]
MTEPTYQFGRTKVNRFDLYELAVQDPPLQARFLQAVHARNPHILTEDFSGPASVARAWLALAPDHKAIAVDRDDVPLRHAVERLTQALPDRLADFTIRERDVLEVKDKTDIIAALNFACCELLTRKHLLTYLRAALYRLQPNGVLVLDTYGGSDAFIPGISEQIIDTEHGELTYRWEQRAADPATSRVQNAIHFELPKRIRVDNAFVYDWRLWSPAEIRDAMHDAGFRTTEVYASYGDAIDEDGALMIHPISRDAQPITFDADLDDQWVLYIVGRA